MTLSTTSKILLFVAISLIAVGSVLFLLTPRTSAPTESQPATGTSETGTEESVVADTVPTMYLYVQPGPGGEIVKLDSEGRTITAISLSILADRDSTITQNWFTLDPQLKEQGWQAAINKATPYDSEVEAAAFDLALINTRPNGGTVFTPDMSIGSFSGEKVNVIDLDSSVSMATTDEGKQIDLQLVREEE